MPQTSQCQVWVQYFKVGVLTRRREALGAVSRLPVRAPLRLQQQPVQVRAAGAVQELARAHAAEHLRQRRLHVVEDDRLPARVEVVDQRLYALRKTIRSLYFIQRISSSFYTDM